MIYLIKQLVGAVATPLVLALFIGAAAGVCRLGRRGRVVPWLMGLAAVVAYLGAISPVGDALLGPLERQYAPLRDDQPLPLVGYVVVLGSGYAPRAGIPVTAALDEEGLVRVVEGVRLVRQRGIAKLVVSGGAPAGKTPSALGYAVLARSLGVDAASLVVLDDSLDTAGEARAIEMAVGATPFILVTSAYHMPRAVRLMRRAGLQPIPAPTGQRVNPPQGFAPGRWLPNSGDLQKCERALHEYLGLVALALTPG
jgi:uncharacterized SAM-binding protein YcdF (DUF218 family)